MGLNDLEAGGLKTHLKWPSSHHCCDMSHFGNEVLWLKTEPGVLTCRVQPLLVGWGRGDVFQTEQMWKMAKHHPFPGCAHRRLCCTENRRLYIFIKCSRPERRFFSYYHSSIMISLGNKCLLEMLSLKWTEKNDSSGFHFSQLCLKPSPPRPICFLYTVFPITSLIITDS